MFEYACDPEMSQISNRVVSRDHMFFPGMAHFFQLENPEIAEFELEILITCFFPEMAHFFSSENPEIAQIELKLSYLRIFKLKKVSHPRKKHVITRKLNGPSLSHLRIACIFNHVILAPSMNF